MQETGTQREQPRAASYGKAVARPAPPRCPDSPGSGLRPDPRPVQEVDCGAKIQGPSVTEALAHF